jgi:hypothetical protein
MNLFDLIEIDATHPPIDHTGHALAIKDASIKALREQQPEYAAVPDDKVWEIIRRKPVSFDLLVLYLGEMSQMLDKHEQQIDRLSAVVLPPT